MRINSNMMSNLDTLNQTSRKKDIEKTNAASSQAATVNTVEKDSVQISANGKEVVDMAKTLRDLPDVRRDRIEELKARIANDTYNVSGKDIAAKIVNSALNGLF